MLRLLPCNCSIFSLLQGIQQVVIVGKGVFRQCMGVANPDVQSMLCVRLRKPHPSNIVIWLLSYYWKTYLLVKPGFFSEAKRIFAGSGIQISSDGFQCLVVATASHNFIRQVAENKISLWCGELNFLSSIAKSYPHPAYATFIHEVMSHWTSFGLQISWHPFC